MKFFVSFASVLLFVASQASAQYVSQVDKDLTIRRAAILPATDNMGGIYAKPIDAELTKLIRSYHQWDFVDLGTEAANAPHLSDLEENVSASQSFFKSLNADAFLAASISKNTTTINVRLDLFLKVDGKLFAQEILENEPRFDIPNLKKKIDEMFERLISKVPYAGLVLSRQQNNVTVNLGARDGIKKGQVLTVFQILKVSRHPKFNFLVSSEKEILGKIKITSVDSTLSFGAIVSEIEVGAIRRLAKISNPNFVSYSDPDNIGDNNSSLDSRADKDIAFGPHPKEWRPAEPPSFGQIGVKFGLGSASAGVNLTNPSASSPGNIREPTALYPKLSVFGELWLNPNWTVRADILEALLSPHDPKGGTLNANVSRYSFSGGYNWLLRDKDFFGPKIQLRGGIANYNFSIDDTTPRLLTSTSYTGLLIGISTSLPVTEDERWIVGAGLDFVLFPHLHETPESSGNEPRNSLIEMTLTGEYRLRPNLNLISSLDFASYHTDFSGGGGRSDGDVASNMSQTYTSINGGIAYLF